MAASTVTKQDIVTEVSARTVCRNNE